MAMIGKVLRMHRRAKKSVREIVKATSLARNTVRKYLRADGIEEHRRYRREPVATKLTPFAEAIKQALRADAHRPKKERRTAKALLKETRPSTVTLMSQSSKHQNAAVVRAKEALAAAEKGLGLMTADDFLAGMQKRAQAAQHRIRATVARKNKRCAG